MVDGSIVIGNLVGLVGGPWPPEVLELSLGSTEADPAESHVHPFEALADNVVGNDAKCGGAVCLHGRRRLLVAHGLKGVAGWDGLATINEQGAQLGFHCRGHDILDDLGNSKDGSIVQGILGVL